jgi:hypothetical protein
MPAARYDLTVEQGARFYVSFIWCVDDSERTRIPLDGRLPYMKITRDGSIVMSSGDIGGIELQTWDPGDLGRIDVSISGLRTAKLLLPYQNESGLEYELVLNDPGDPGNVIRLLEGRVLVHREV